MNTWDIIGHKTAVQFLQTSIDHGLRAHGFLFAGPDRVGKMTLARAFARALIGGDIGTHPDVLCIRREEDKKQISIDQVREMQSRLSRTSFLNSYKVAIIENAHELSDGAAHALLKVLEEPRKHTVIIMTVTDVGRLLPTIVSRMQTIRCLPVPSKELYDALVARDVHRPLAADLAAIARGCPGVALSLASDADAYEAYRVRMKRIFAALAGTIADKSAVAESIVAEQDPASAVEAVTSAVRDVLYAAVFSPDAAAHRFAAADIGAAASAVTMPSLVRCLTHLERAHEFIAANVSPRLTLEHAFFHIY